MFTIQFYYTSRQDVLSIVNCKPMLLNTKRFKQTYLSPKIAYFDLHCAVWLRTIFHNIYFTLIAWKIRRIRNALRYSICTRISEKILNVFRKNLTGYVFSGLSICNFTYSYVFLSNIEYTAFCANFWGI